ncbi:MAG: N-(5'-phosphoribosyl)anthranilate isomerase [Planctomycetota bacterium]
METGARMKASFALPRVKVCGITRREDLLLALDAGADAVGFVAEPRSPRAVEAAAASRILAAASGRAFAAVGVFVDRDPAPVAAWAREAGVGAVQLCGREQPADWKGFPLPILRRIAVAPEAPRELEAWKDLGAGFVLDHPSGAGGTGRSVDPDFAGRLASLAPCILAGGLEAASVTAAVRRIRPAGVDASSRLESAPGIKDPARVHAFVNAALAALEEVPT